MGAYAGVDYNLTVCSLQSRLHHIYHGQPHAIVVLNPMPESTLSPIGDFRFGLRILFSEAKKKYSLLSFNRVMNIGGHRYCVK